MSRIVKPVRAWAEYDEWSVYLEEYNDEWHNVLVPKGGGEGWFCEFAVYSGVADFVREIKRPIDSPLRSLRVLYENGYELRTGPTEKFPDRWGWIVFAPGETFEAARGAFKEDKDSEAVERALIAAAAWFTQAEGLDT